MKTLKQALRGEPLRPTAAFSVSVDEALDRLPARNTKSVRPPRRLAMALCAALILCALPLGYRALAPNGHPLAQPDPVTSRSPEGEPVSAAPMAGRAPFEPLSAVPMPQVTEPDDAIEIPAATENDTAIPIPALPPAPEQTATDPDYAIRFEHFLYKPDGTSYTPFAAPLSDRSLMLVGLYAQFGQLKFTVATDDGKSAADLRLRQVYLNGEPVTADFPIPGKRAENARYLGFNEDGGRYDIELYPMTFTCVAPEVDYLRNGGRHLISAVFEQNGHAAVISVYLNARSGSAIDIPDESGAKGYGLAALSQMLQENCGQDSRAAVYYPVPPDKQDIDDLIPQVTQMRHSWGKLAVRMRLPGELEAAGGQLTLNGEALYLLSVERDSDDSASLIFFTDAKPGAYEGANVNVSLTVDCTEDRVYGMGFSVDYEMSTALDG